MLPTPRPHTSRASGRSRLAFQWSVLGALALLLLPALAGAAPAAVPASLLVPATGSRAAGRLASWSRPGAVRVRIDRGALEAFRAGRGGRMSLPMPDGSTRVLALRAFEILDPEATVTATSDRGVEPLEPDLTLFRGEVEEEPGSWAVLELSPRGMLGVVDAGGERFVIAPVEPPSPGAPPPEHAVAREASLDPPAAAFACGADALPRSTLALAPHPVVPGQSQVGTSRLVCELAVDCDYEYTAVKFGGNVTNATNYALLVLAVVSTIYERDLNVTIQVPYLNLWTTSADPYTAGNTTAELPEFQTWWNTNRASVHRDIAHLMSGRNLGGGIAYLSVLCNSTMGYGVSQIDGFYTYPTSTSTWDAMVLAHEIGHNFGSWHTHSCEWQANGYWPSGQPLDSCYTVEGTCYSGAVGILPPNKGTIMSYCHQVAGVAGGIRLEFHDACKLAMRIGAEAGCLDPATVQPPRNLVAELGSGVADLSWAPSPSAGVIGYEVYRSAVPLDPNPAFVASTAGLSYEEPVLGAWTYKVRAMRASDQSPFSNEASPAACPMTLPAAFPTGTQPVDLASGDFNGDGVLDLVAVDNAADQVEVIPGLGGGAYGPATAFAVGSHPSAVTVADFNDDGILDLAVANTSGASVTILLGQGSNGVGNGSFATSATLVVGTAPLDILAGDFNEDGLTDLAVANSGGTTVSILRGLGGTDGTANGSFAAAVGASAGTAPRALAAGDWNEDGITDLAAVNSTGVRILRGLGTGGKGNGTFSSNTSYNAGAFPYSIITGDWNQDGITDLAVGNATGGTVSVLLGHGSGGVGDGLFNAALPYAANAIPYSVVTGDWNGDGIADLAVANGTSVGVSILLGRGTGGVGDGTFAAPLFEPAGSDPRALLPGDWNGDGSPDLAIANASGGDVATLLASCGTSLPTTLSVLSPNGGELWQPGGERTISWTRGAGVVAVDLAISRDGGTHWERIAGALTGSSFAWTVTGPYGPMMRIRVQDSTVPARSDQSDANFAIVPNSLLDAPAPAAPTIALRSENPAPAGRDLELTCWLDPARPARLELVDLSGRRRAQRVLEGVGGPARVALPGTARLEPGLYLARLTQDARSATVKIARLR